MKIAYITNGSPYNKNSWSGTNYYVRKTLEDQGHEVYCIYDAPKCPLIHRVLARIARCFNMTYHTDRTRLFSKKWSKVILSRLQPGTDAIVSLGTIPVAYLETRIPIFIYVDGIFEQMRTYYKWGNIPTYNLREANHIEQMAINRCTKIVSCSLETTKAIEQFYDGAKGKTATIPLGANWDTEPTKDEVQMYIQERNKDVCRLLFCGVEWERKGADIVVDTVKLLHSKGFPVELHMCGLKEIPIELPPYVINHGFIAKSSQEGLDKLKELFTTSHFLFVPSRAEAYGLVFCEASAYGVPTISHRTGGLYTIVKDGVNGQLFDLGTTPEIFAEYIERMFNNYREYIDLANSSYMRYKSDLNWEVSGRLLSDLIRDNIK